MDIEKSGVLTPPEVAAEMRVSVDTVLRLLRNGRLHGYKFGKQWRIPRGELDTYLAESSSHRGKNVPPNTTAAT